MYNDKEKVWSFECASGMKGLNGELNLSKKEKKTFVPQTAVSHSKPEACRHMVLSTSSKCLGSWGYRVSGFWGFLLTSQDPTSSVPCSRYPVPASWATSLKL